MAVVDAVVAGEVAGGFGGGDDVVGGDAVLGVGQGNIDERGALLLVPLRRRLLHGGFDFRLHAFHAKYSLGRPMRRPLSGVFSSRQIIGHGLGPAGGIPRVVAGDHLQEQCGVLDRQGHGADLIERGGERDQAVAADEAVGGLEADDAAEGGGLADGAAGIGAEAAEAHAGRRRRRRHRRWSRRGRSWCSRDSWWGRRRSFRWRSPWRIHRGWSCRG